MIFSWVLAKGFFTDFALGFEFAVLCLCVLVLYKLANPITPSLVIQYFVRLKGSVSQYYARFAKPLGMALVNLVAAALAGRPVDLFDQLLVSDLVDRVTLIADDSHGEAHGF